MSVTVSDQVRPGTSRVVGQVAGFEGLRLLRSPVLWLATIASGVVAWLAWRGNPKVLDWQSVAVAGSCLPLAAVALLTAHGAARRDRSFEVDEITKVPPTGVDRRMMGLVVAGWAPVGLSVGVVVFGVIVNMFGDPAGSFRFAELVVGPMVVALGHATGVALGRWAAHPLVAPLALIVVAALFLIADFWPGARVIPASSPFLPWRKPYTDWLQGEPREPLVHILYLAGLIVAATGFGTRSLRILAAGGAVVVATTIALSGIPVGGEEVAAAVEDWGSSQPQTCRDDQGVQICAIDGYEPWLDDWSEALDGLRGLVPTRLGLVEIQQTTSAAFWDTDPTVAEVGGDWETPAPADPKGHGSVEARSLAMQVLAPELGLPGTAGESAQMNTELPACMAGILPLFVSGQARGIGLMVLSELAVPDSVQTSTFTGPVQFGQIEVSGEELGLALAILERPRDDVLSTLHANWEKLTDPATTTTELAGWFGLLAPATLSSSSYADMTCVCTSDGSRCSSGEAP